MYFSRPLFGYSGAVEYLYHSEYATRNSVGDSADDGLESDFKDTCPLCGQMQPPDFDSTLISHEIGVAPILYRVLPLR